MQYRTTTLVFLLLVASSLMTGCSGAGALPLVANTPMPPATLQPATNTPESQAVPTNAVPSNGPTAKPQATTSVQTAIPNNATPVALSGKIATYRDDFAGIELDYPAGWTVFDVKPENKKQAQAYSITFHSYKPGVGGSQGIPAGQSKIDLSVEPRTTGAYEEVVAMRKQQIAAEDRPAKILSEAQWTLAGEAKATRLQLEASGGDKIAELVTSLNGKMVLLDGYGDLRLFDAIAQTLRTIPATNTKGALPANAVWVFVNGRVAAVAQGTPSVDLKEPGKEVFSGPGQTLATPDGLALLYFRLTTNPYNQELMLLDTRTGKTRSLAQGAALWSPRLSPDGRSVAFTLIDSANYDNAKWELVIQDLAGGRPRVVLSERKNAQGTLTPLVPVHWTANGLLVEKNLWASDAPPQGLYRVDTTNGALKPVYEKPYVRAVVSPDGNKAALVQGQIQMGEGQVKLALNVLDLATGQVKPVVPETAISLTSIRWSPDSSKLLYIIQESPTVPAAEVHVMNADGSNAQTLKMEVQYPLRDVAWRDNRTLLFLMAGPQNTLHVAQVPLDKLDLQSSTEIGRVPGSDPQNPGDTFIYVPQ